MVAFTVQKSFRGENLILKLNLVGLLEYRSKTLVLKLQIFLIPQLNGAYV